MTSVSNDCALYYQTKTSIGFSCRHELNHRSLIQLSEFLPVELIEIDNYQEVKKKGSTNKKEEKKGSKNKKEEKKELNDTAN